MKHLQNTPGFPVYIFKSLFFKSVATIERLKETRESFNHGEGYFKSKLDQQKLSVLTGTTPFSPSYSHAFHWI